MDKERVCGECFHCEACEAMLRSCYPGDAVVAVDLASMPIGTCEHFFEKAGPEKLHDEFIAQKEKFCAMREEFARLSNKNDVLTAQLDIVRLIFGKGTLQC